MSLPIGAILGIIDKAQTSTGNMAKSIAPVAASLSKSARAQRKLVEEDTEKLKRGQLGLSEAEKRQRLADALRAQRSRTQDQDQALQRQQAMAGGRSGAVAQQQGQLAQAEGAAAAMAAQGINRESQQLAEQRRAQILQRIRQQQQLNRQNWEDATKNIGKKSGEGNSSKPDSAQLSALYKK